jgi:hypothetical protein
LDREWQAAYNLRVVARDMPRRGGPDQKSATTMVRVVLTDVNDSPPQFTQSRYSAVVPENSPVGTLIAQVDRKVEEFSAPLKGLSGEMGGRG